MVRTRRGFGWWGRLMALAIVGILAFVAWSALRSTPAERRTRARLTAELVRLDSLETAHFARFGFYTSNAGRTDARGYIPFLPTAGLQVILIRADSLGWAAGVRSDPDALPSDWHGCAVFAGPPTYAPDPRVTTPHRPACW